MEPFIAEIMAGVTEGRGSSTDTLVFSSALNQNSDTAAPGGGAWTEPEEIIKGVRDDAPRPAPAIDVAVDIAWVDTIDVAVDAFVF